MEIQPPIEKPTLITTEVSYMGKEGFASHEVEVSPYNQMTFITPIYREWESGNIRTQLKSFAKQTAGENTFEVIYVVNNRDPHASDTNQDAVSENQETLRFLSAVQNPSLPIDAFSPEVQKDIKDLRTRGIRINYVDMATTGIYQTNIGQLRQVGMDIATRRQEGTMKRKNGIVINFDADCTVTPDYVEQIQREFDNPDTQVVVTDIEYTPEYLNDPKYTESMAKALYREELLSLRTTLYNGQITWGSPRVTMRISALEKVGGMPKTEASEDFYLALRLIEKFRNTEGIHMRPDLCVTTLFRAREDNPQYFDSSAIAKNFRIVEEGINREEIETDSFWSYVIIALTRESQILHLDNPAEWLRVQAKDFSNLESFSFLASIPFEDLTKKSDPFEIYDWIRKNLVEKGALSEVTFPPIAMLPLAYYIVNRITPDGPEQDMASQLQEIYYDRLNALLAAERSLFGDKLEGKEYTEVGQLSPNDTTYRQSSLQVRFIHNLIQAALVDLRFQGSREVIKRLILYQQTVYDRPDFEEWIKAKEQKIEQT